MDRLVNPKGNRRLRRRKVFREALPFSSPWWDLVWIGSSLFARWQEFRIG